jgi:DNA-binding NarL/FixJ family response regulator
MLGRRTVGARGVRVIRVLLVEDHTAFREALAFLLGGASDIEVAAQAGSLAETREALDGGFDVAVADLGLPDGDGRELIGELRTASPGISVLVLNATIKTEHLDDLHTPRADAVLAKVESPSVIVEEVRRLAGEQAASGHDDRGV